MDFENRKFHSTIPWRRDFFHHEEIKNFSLFDIFCRLAAQILTSIPATSFEINGVFQKKAVNEP